MDESGLVLDWYEYQIIKSLESSIRYSNRDSSAFQTLESKASWLELHTNYSIEMDAAHREI